jgi:hypothetical protein
MPYKDYNKRLERSRTYYKENRDARLKYIADWQAKNKDKTKKYTKAWRDKNKEFILETHRIKQHMLKQVVCDYYGPNCVCCGEKDYHFLSIDHIENGRGNPAKRHTSGTIYRWLKKNNFPSGFQTLCYNCNLAKGFYGVCPHKERPAF